MRLTKRAGGFLTQVEQVCFALVKEPFCFWGGLKLCGMSRTECDLYRRHVLHKDYPLSLNLKERNEENEETLQEISFNAACFGYDFYDDTDNSICKNSIE